MSEIFEVNSISNDEAADLTAKLVSIRSCPGEEGDVQRFIADWLRAAGMTVELQETENDRPNVVASFENGAGKTFMLNGHADTVLAAADWKHDPWLPRRDEANLYGLGACDMKSGIAAIMLAARELIKRTDLWQGKLLVTTVVDEEAYSLGARTLLESGIQADYCIVTESSWVRPIIGGVGKVLVRVDAKGKACHGSWPRDGINAAVEAAKLLVAIEGMPMAHHHHLTPTQCVLDFHSGSQQYVITVPEHARFRINAHTVPGQTDAEFVDGIRGLADAQNSPATFEVNIDPPHYPAWEISADHELPRAFAQAFSTETGEQPDFGYNQGVADTNLFADSGIPTIQFGPHGGKYHAAGEWVDIKSIAATARILIDTVVRLTPKTK